MAVAELLSSSHVSYVLVSMLIVSLFYLVLSCLTSRPNVPENLPWIGRKAGQLIFPEFRAAIECLRRQRENLANGYSKYLRNGRSYIFPTLGSGPLEIIIPNNRLRWLLDFPDDRSSVSEAHVEMLAGRYAFTHPDLMRIPFEGLVFHQNMARRISMLIEPTWDEVKFQINQSFGADTGDWKDIVLLPEMTTVVSAVSNRMLVGLPLARNARFRALNMNFATGIMVVISVLQFLPHWTHFIVGHIAAVPNHICMWQTKQYTLPIIKQRLKELEDDDGPSESPETFITWQIRLAKAQGNMRECDPDWIARRLLVMEFATLHTSSFAITNVLLDLLSSDPRLGYLEAIREEAEMIYKKHKGIWSKQALAEMIRTDSAIRESMRVSGISVRGVHRKVIDKDGLHYQTEDESWTAPYGSIVATDVYTRHHDPELYPEPFKYDAFRFSREREKATDESPIASHVKRQNLSLISTSDSFLPFGHGRHACPGRFFINLELKVMLAYILMNYDLEPLAGRPANTLIGEVIIPPTKQRIRVKRRASSLTDIL